MADERAEGGHSDPTETRGRKIAKLRWLGLEHEANQLAHALETPSPTGECLTEPVDTD